jgi:hypothetical protein
MPLSEPESRELLHTRDIMVHGYRRADGLFDIEAQLTDTKSYGFAVEDRGWIEPGEPLHGMWMRMTVDADLLIVACEAVSDYTPYTVCPAVTPNFARLAGLRIKPGFLKQAAQRVGGSHGCTHLRELLQQMATTAFQTTYPVRARKEQEGGTPRLLNSCYAYASDSPVVRRRWPHLYSGTEPGPSELPEGSTSVAEN